MLQRMLRIAACISVILSCSWMNTAQAIPFSQISQVYFFGDSLTDSGFNDYYPTPSGKAPTFTTYEGYIWSQYVALDIKGFPLTPSAQYPYVPVSPPFHPIDFVTNNTTPIDPLLCPGGVCPVSGLLRGVDYACGGSTTNSTGFAIPWAPSLRDQVHHFIATNEKLDPKALYFIWSGANDLLTVFSESSTSPNFQYLLLKAADTAAKNIATEVARLTEHGARRVVVVSLPNFGLTPLINDLVVDQVAPETLITGMKNASFTFNSMLNQRLGGVTKLFGTDILLIDTYDLLNHVVLATKAGRPVEVGGEVFEFTNYNSPVCGYIVPPGPGIVPIYVPALVCTNTSNGYIFADSVHPTNEAHRLISVYVEEQIRAWA